MVFKREHLNKNIYNAGIVAVLLILLTIGFLAYSSPGLRAAHITGLNLVMITGAIAADLTLLVIIIRLRNENTLRTRAEKEIQNQQKHLDELVKERTSELKALKEEHNQIAAFVKQADEAIFSKTLDGIILSWNQGAQKMYGYTEEEIKGKPVSILMTPDNKHEMIGILQKVRTGEAVRSFESMRMRKDGTLFTVSTSVLPVKNLQGEIIGASTIAHDITGRKKVENLLRQREERLVLAADAARLGVFEWNIKSDTPIWDNPRMFEIFGISPQAPPVSREQFEREVIHSDDLPRFQQEIQESLQNRIPFEGKYRIRRLNDGQWRWIEYLGRFEYDEKGDVIRLIGVIGDITERKQAEQALRESERRFRQVVESLPQLVWTCAPDGSCDFLSPQWIRYTGKSESEQLGYGWLEQLHPDDRQRTVDQWQKTSAKGENFNVEFRIRRYDGEYRWFHTLAVPLYDIEGKIVKWFGSNTDIHDIKLAEEELRQSESALSTIIDALPVGIITADSRGRLTRINPATRELWGIPPKTEKWEQYGNWIGWWPQTGERIKAEEWALARALRNGEEIRNELVRNEKFVTHEQRFYLANAVPLRDVNGQIIGGVVAMLDITDRLLIEQKLRESEARFRTMFERHGAIMLLIEPDKGTIVDANAAAEAFYGYSLNELRSMRIQQINQELPEQVASELHKAVEKERNIFEFRHRISSGQVRTVEVYSSPIRVADKSLLFSIIQDITERKAAEEALKYRSDELAAVNRDLESFSYSVSHDLRNPLGLINGFVSLLIEDYSEKLDETGLDYLRRIDDSVKKTQLIVKNMLSLSRVGRQDVKRTDVNISSIVRKYLSELKSSDLKRQVQFVIEDNVYVNADQGLIHLALENLLRNAWKFTSKQEVTRIEFGVVKCKSENESRTKDEDEYEGGLKKRETVFFIRDNGAGFDMQFAKKIFEPFKRVHAEKDFGGTGIGLSIVQRVIERHGGKVWAEGKVDKGAVFYFTLGY